MARKARVFRVFVSSTFSDMFQERDLLQARVFPALRRICEANNVRFQAIDLRWGVSNEAVLNQRATDLCLSEIARCQRMTTRPNFLLLLGNRYGWQPLPDDIPADEWDVLTEYIRNNDLKILNIWYRRDDNAVPPLYILQPRTGEYTDGEKWKKVEEYLREILQKAVAGLGWSHERRMKYEASVTEQEIEAGIFNYAGAQEAAFCFFRTIDGLPSDKKDYRESNPKTQKRLRDLKQRLKTQIPANIQHYQTQWIGDKLHFDEDSFCEAVEARLKSAIKAELATFEKASPLEIEEENHRQFLIDRIRHFVGRGNVLEQVAHYLTSDDHLPLVLHGQSGVGKSTVMAKAIEATPDAFYHFIGVTPTASDIRAVWVNLCETIRARYDLTDAVPQDYKELIQAIPQFLAVATPEKPIIIFLDALDQLVPTNNPSNLRWLPSELPPHVKLVVSVIPSPHLDALQSRLPKTAFYEITPIQAADGAEMLDRLLHDAGRTLQPAQRAEVLGKFALNGLPLYLKLAFEEARRWHSYTNAFTLQSDVPSLLQDNLFARLSDAADHGAMLVERSLGYLAAARNGLSEGEMLDLLTTDADFWADFVQNRTHEPQREALKAMQQLPIVVWSRLVLDLEAYIVERGADNTVLMAFYHRQFSETVDALYLAPYRETRHTHLAHYFKSQSVYTHRKVAEQAYQQAKAGLHEDYVATLTDYAYLQACLDARGVTELIEDCSLRQDVTIGLIQSALGMSVHVVSHDKTALAEQLAGRLMSHRPQNPEIKTFTDGLEPPQHLIYPYHLNLLQPTHQQAGGALLRTLEGHTSSVTSVALSGEFAISTSGFYDNSTDNTLRVWNWVTGEHLRTLKGHTNAVNSVALSGEFAISASVDTTLRVWNWVTGEHLRTLKGHTNAVNSVALSGEFAISASLGELCVFNWVSGKHMWTLGGDSWVNSVALSGEFAISASSDRTLRVWNWMTGKHLRTLEGHMDDVNSVALSGEFAISTSGSYADMDYTLRVWNWMTGKHLRTLEGHTSSVNSVALSDEFAISASSDGTLRVWNWVTGEHLRTLRGHTSSVNSVALSDEFAISASSDGTLRVWNWMTTEFLRTLEGHTSYVTSVALSGEFAISASTDRSLRVWRLPSPVREGSGGKSLGEPLRILEGHTSYVTSVALSDEFAISASTDRSLRVWNWQTGEYLRTLRGHTDKVNDVALSDEFAISVSGSYANMDYTLRVWNWMTGEYLRTLEGHTSSVNSVALSGEFAISVSGSYANMDYTLRVWNWQTGEALRTLEGHMDDVNSVALSGEFAISASSDGTLRVWNWQTGEALRTLEGHMDDVNSVALSGEFAISASSDGTLRVWNWQTGEQHGIFYGDAPLEAVAVRDEGDKLLIVAGDRTGRVLFLRWRGGHSAS